MTTVNDGLYMRESYCRNAETSRRIIQQKGKPVKNSNLAQLVAAALLTMSSASAFAALATGSDQLGHYSNMHSEKDLTASITLEESSLPLNSVFTQDAQLTTEKSTVQHAGNFTVTGLKADTAYVLGNGTADGVDKSGYDLTAGTSIGWTTTAETNATNATNVVAISSDGSDTAYVKINHLATAPVAGVTTITIPVTSYTK
ncbi:hypothetical protein ACE3YI_004939 [Salmonella enterica]